MIPEGCERRKRTFTSNDTPDKASRSLINVERFAKTSYLGPRGPIGSMKKDVSGVRRPARATLLEKSNGQDMVLREFEYIILFFETH
jgi:hypothetical protein